MTQFCFTEHNLLRLLPLFVAGLTVYLRNNFLETSMVKKTQEDSTLMIINAVVGITDVNCHRFVTGTV